MTNVTISQYNRERASLKFAKSLARLLTPAPLQLAQHTSSQYVTEFSSNQQKKFCKPWLEPTFFLPTSFVYTNCAEQMWKSPTTKRSSGTLSKIAEILIFLFSLVDRWHHTVAAMVFFSLIFPLSKRTIKVQSHWFSGNASLHSTATTSISESWEGKTHTHTQWKENSIFSATNLKDDYRASK